MVDMTVIQRLRPVLLAVLVIGSLAGCSAGRTDPTPTEATAAAAPAAGGSTSTPTSSPAVPLPVVTSRPSSTPTCGPADPSAAITQAAARLGPPAGIDGARWDVAGAVRDGYDRCAGLSWVVLRPVDSTGSSPSAILLFHDGAYLGTATKEQYGFEPDVVRTSDDAVTVTYRFPEQNEGNADASGRATATYTWDERAGRVVMSGDVPPTD
jgi:hypothetical protein